MRITRSGLKRTPKPGRGNGKSPIGTWAVIWHGSEATRGGVR